MTLNTPNINHSITTDTSVNADAKHSVTPTGSFSFIETQAGAKAYAKYGDVLTGSFNIIGSNAGIKIYKYELADNNNHTILSKAQVNAFALHGAPDNLGTSISATGQIKVSDYNNNETGNVLNIITKIGRVQYYPWLHTPFVYPSIRATANTNVYFKEAGVSTTDIISGQAGIYIPIGKYNTMQVEAWYSLHNNPTIDKRVLGYYNGEYVFGIRLRKFIGTDIINEISTIAHVTAEKGSRMPQVEQSITAHGDARGIYRGNTDVIITNDPTIITKVGVLAIAKDVAFDEHSITIDALSEATAHAKHAVTNNIVEILSVIHNVDYKQGENIMIGRNEYISSSSAGVKIVPYKLVEPIQEVINSDAHAVGHAIAHEVPETQHIINGLLSNANALVFANDIHSVIQSITTAMEIIVMEDRPTQDVSDIISATAYTSPAVFNSVVEASEVIEVSSFDTGVYNPKDEELPNVLEQLDTLHGLDVIYDGKAVREKINYIELSDNGYNVVQIDLETIDKTDVLNTLVDASVYYSGRIIFNLDQASIHKGETSYLAIVGDNLETNEQAIDITSEGFSDTLYSGKIVDALYELSIGTQSGADYVYGLDTYIARTDLIHPGESGVSLYHTGRVTLDHTDSIVYSGGLLKPVVVDNYIDNSENTIMSSANSEQVVGDMLDTTGNINSITNQFGLSVDYNGKVTDTLSDSVIYAVGDLGQLYMNYDTPAHSDYLTADADVPPINDPTHYDISEIIQNILNVYSYGTNVYYSGRIAVGDLEDNIAGTSNATAVERNYSIIGIIQNISKSAGTSLNFNGKVVTNDIQHTITIDHGVEYYRIVPTEDVSETINAECGLGNIIYDVKETQAITNNINISATAANTHTKHAEVGSRIETLLAIMDIIVQYNGKVPLPNIDNIVVQHGLQHAYGRDAYTDPLEDNIYAIADGLSIVGAAKTATSTHSAVAVANASAYYTGRVTGASTHSISIQYGTDYVYGADTYVARTENIMVSADAEMFRGGANTDNILQNILALADTTVSYRAYNASATNTIDLINSGYATGVIKDSYTPTATHSITGNSSARTIKNTPTHNALNTMIASSNASAYYTGRVSSPVLHNVNVSNFGYVTGPIKNSTTTSASHTITSNTGIRVTKHLITQATTQSITKVANAIARVKNSTTSSASHSITKIADATVTYRGANRSFVFYPMMWDNASNYQAGQVNALLGDVWHNNNGTLTKVATQTHYWQGSIVDDALFSIRNVTLAAGIEYASKGYTTPHNSLTLVSDSYPTNWTLQGIPSNVNERQARIIYRGKSYNVNFNNNGGIGSTSTQYRVNPTAAYSISLSAHTPTRTGSTFTGWTITSGPGTISGNSISMPQWTASNNAYGNINVTANWNTNTYSITRTLGTGVAAATISPASYNVTTATFTPTLSGITYSRGYSSYSVSPTITSIPTGSTGNKNYTLTASKISYTIDINENGGGSVSNPSNYVINPSSSQTKTFTAPTRTNYSISSWTVTGHNGTIPTVSGTSGTVTLTIPANTIGNLSVRANWTYTGPYYITLDMGGGTGGSVASTYYEQNSVQQFPITNPTRPGYTLTGYLLTTNPAGASIPSPIGTSYLLNIPANRTGDIEFVTTWSSNSYTITRGTNSSYFTINSYNYSTSTSSQTRTISYSRTGYEFVSASITRTGTYGGSAPTVSGTTITIPANSYGTFTVNVNAKGKTFNITLNKQSGSGGTSTIAVTYATSISPTSGNITLPTRSGYTFQGYYTATSGGTQRINASGTYVALNTTTYSSAATLYARWEASGGGGQTATPTVGTPSCDSNMGGTNFLKVSVKNNDTSSATIKRATVTIGTVAAGATATLTLYSGFSTPYNYNVSITATATGKTQSTAVSKSGSVSLCMWDGSF